jgi:hypothetical protein
MLNDIKRPTESPSCFKTNEEQTLEVKITEIVDIVLLTQF